MNLRNLTLGLALLPALTNAAENGTWNSQIKESSYAFTDANCSYGGFHEAKAMVYEFNTSKHSVWMGPIGGPSFTTTFDTLCNWKNLESVSKTWNRLRSACSGCSPIVYGVMTKNEFNVPTTTSGTSGLTALQLYAAKLNTLATLLTGPTPLRLGLSIDDAQAGFRTTLKPSGAHSIGDFATAYNSIKVASPNVEISPYFEAAIAMSLVGDTYRIGIPSVDTFNVGESASLTFVWNNGVTGGSRRLFQTPVGTKVEFPIADLYLNDDSTRKLEFSVETSSDGGATWGSSPIAFDLTDTVSLGTRFHHFSHTLSSIERSAMYSGLFQIKATLRHTGTRNALANYNKLVLLGAPMVDVPSGGTWGTSGTGRFSFARLQAKAPGAFTSTSSFSSSRMTSAIAGATPVAEKLLDDLTSTRLIDGVFFKTDSNPTVFNPVTEALVAENICSAPKSVSLPCRSVTWGSSLQGTATLSAETEAKRYIATLPYVSGSVSYNYPLDLAAPADGVLEARVSSSGIANSLGVFLWPFDTRGIDGYTRRWEWTVPLDYPVGQPSTLTWGPIPVPGSSSGRSASPTNSCTLPDSTSGTEIPAWRFSLEGTLSGSHPETNLKNSADLSTTFTPVPGETLTLQLAPLNVSIGTTLCYAEGFITLPSGYTPSSGAFLSGLSDTVSASTNANDLFSCVRYLFQNPTVSSFSAIPAGICPP